MLTRVSPQRCAVALLVLVSGSAALSGCAGPGAPASTLAVSYDIEGTIDMTSGEHAEDCSVTMASLDGREMTDIAGIADHDGNWSWTLAEPGRYRADVYCGDETGSEEFTVDSTYTEVAVTVS